MYVYTCVYAAQTEQPTTIASEQVVVDKEVEQSVREAGTRVSKVAGSQHSQAKSEPLCGMKKCGILQSPEITNHLISLMQDGHLEALVTCKVFLWCVDTYP